MIKDLRIKNFKGWKDTGEMKMAPLTLLFGTNSSGKSSIGQFLMMLKQTAESQDRKIVLFSGSNDSAVNVGTFREFIHDRDVGNLLEFSYTWEIEDPMDIPGFDKSKKKHGYHLRFDAVIQQNKAIRQGPFVKEFTYKIFNNYQDSNSPHDGLIGLSMKDNKLEYETVSEGIELKKQKGRYWDLKSTLRFYGFPDEMVAYHQNADFVKDLNLIHGNLFKTLFYLGPLRNKAERLYTWAGIEPDSVGHLGQNTIAAILSAKKRKLNFGKGQTLHEFEKLIAIELQKMTLIEDFRVDKIADNRQEYEVKVKMKGSKKYVGLPDIGFGVSQVLPVIVQLFYAPRNSLIFIEQPELHLHPKAQAELADVVIDAIKSHEKGKPRNLQLVLETHSEHFLRRLQRRVAEDVISEDDLAVYFANVTDSGSILEPLQLDTFGNISNWPENFFGDEMEDIIAQTEAAERKISRKSR
jgi:predicted ATPase